MTSGTSSRHERTEAHENLQRLRHHAQETHTVSNQTKIPAPKRRSEHRTQPAMKLFAIGT